MAFLFKRCIFIYMYKIAFNFLKIFFSEAALFKHGFNISPMYRSSVGKLMYVSNDLHEVQVQIPLNYKNRNYVGAIFGGSMLSATDPIYMIQLMNILKDDYIVWDKEVTIKYKRPAKENVYAEFTFSHQEINEIKSKVLNKGEFNLVKTFNIVNTKNVVFAEVTKSIYIANKAFYSKKRKLKRSKK